MQLLLCLLGQNAGRVFFWGRGVANLHPDPDSANLAATVLKFADYFRRKLAQFRGERAVVCSDVKRALTQSCHLAGLREIRRRRMAKVLLQLHQCLRGVEERAQLRIVAHQGF